MISSGVENALCERKLSGGKFTDDIVIGLPTTVSEKGQIHYRIPSEAGILRQDQSLSTTDIRSPPFSGMDKDKVPRALFVSQDGQAAYVADDGPRLRDGRKLEIKAFDTISLGLSQTYAYNSAVIAIDPAAGPRGPALFDRKRANHANGLGCARESDFGKTTVAFLQVAG